MISDIYGYYSWTFYSGIAILNVTPDYEKVKCLAFSIHDGEEDYTKPTWHKIKFNHVGEPYFMKYGRRYYLKDCIRTNIAAF